MGSTVLMESTLNAWPVRRGKVRDIYDLGDQLLLVSTDRLSAFDWVLPTGIPDKGRVLTQVSNYWFDLIDQPNHLISSDVNDFPLPANANIDELDGRTILVKKTMVVPIECVVRGYLVGSGWNEYQKRGTVCGIQLPKGLTESERLPEPIFTPSTKAEEGHDENISFEQMVDVVGQQTADELRRRSLEVYDFGAKIAAEKGIIIADTKLEWGHWENELILIDEVLTPDSSRFWPADLYQSGQSQVSFDKQFVRDWLSESGWDKNSPPPALPADITAKTRSKYIEAYERLTEHPFFWK